MGYIINRAFSTVYFFTVYCIIEYYIYTKSILIIIIYVCTNLSINIPYPTISWLSKTRMME